MLLTADDVFGTVDTDLLAGAGSWAHNAFAALPAVTAPDYYKLILDADNTGGLVEIAHIIGHTAGSATVTIQRGFETDRGAGGARDHRASTSPRERFFIGPTAKSGELEFFETSWAQLFNQAGTGLGDPALGTGGSLLWTYDKRGRAVTAAVTIALGSAPYTGMPTGTVNTSVRLGLPPRLQPFADTPRQVMTGFYVNGFGFGWPIWGLIDQSFSRTVMRVMVLNPAQGLTTTTVPASAGGTVNAITAVPPFLSEWAPSAATPFPAGANSGDRIVLGPNRLFV